MWQLNPILTYNKKKVKNTHFFSNSQKSRDLRTFAEVFWPREVAAQKFIDFCDSGGGMGLIYIAIDSRLHNR